MEALLDRYRGFHQLMLASDGGTITFHEARGFLLREDRADAIHTGDDH